MARLLLVEDHASLADSLGRGLREEGFEVEPASDGLRAAERLATAEFDLCVLDLGLPGLDGFEVLSRTRSAGKTLPILVLTARDATADRVRGLELGADDYLVKPFAFEELLARLRALLRRSQIVRKETGTRAPRSVGDLTIDPASRRVTVGANAIELSQKQFALLEYLARHAGEVVTREAVLRDVWGYDFDPGTNVVDVHIGMLRHRIDTAGTPSRIRTVRGVGYCLETP